MAKVSVEELQLLKCQCDLVKLIRSVGLEVKKQGEVFVMRCPFHEDTGQALQITPKKGRPDLWECKECGAAGDVVDWLMLYKKLSQLHAVELLRAYVNNPGKAGKGKMELPPLLQSSMPPEEVMRTVAGYYHEKLLAFGNTEDPIKFFANRGIDQEVIEAFNIGCADRTLGLRLPNAETIEGGKVRRKQLELGLYRETGREHLYGCLTFPLHDYQTGEVVSIYGRRLKQGKTRGGKKPAMDYWTDQSRGVFNLEGFKGAQEVVLCESITDALTFWSYGIKNVTCCFDHIVSEDFLNAVKLAETKTVKLAFIRPEYVDEEAERVSRLFNENRIATSRVMLPLNQSVNDFVMSFSEDNRKEALEQVVRSAEFLLGSTPQADIVQAKKLAAKTTVVIPESEESKAHFESIQAPSIPRKDERLECNEDYSECKVVLETRHYRIRGLQKNTTYEKLKVQLKATRLANGTSGGEAFHLDTLDLCQASRRLGFIKHAALELNEPDETIKKDISIIFNELEVIRDRLIDEKRKALESPDPVLSMSPEERKAGLAFLRDPNLLERIKEDFQGCGIVGESTNSLVGYLAATSRLLEKPLAIVVQSSSAAGKSALMDAVLAFMPPESVCQYSAMTGQSLYYFGADGLQHKILAIAEEQGAEQASYSLKLFQSQGSLKIAAPGKDADGRMHTQEYEVKGPAAIFLTTTAIDIDEELLNRCLVLSVNENREQTRRIHEAQREAETLEGLQRSIFRKETYKRHHAAQRLLEPIHVINPFAKQLKFLNHKTRTRRDHPKYLALIKAVTLLHQHQREKKEAVSENGQVYRYIETTIEDIELAGELFKQVISHSLGDLPPQSQFLLDLLWDRVNIITKDSDADDPRNIRFSKRDIREWSGWSDRQVRRHVERLVGLEYLNMIRDAGRWLYELLHDYRNDEATKLSLQLIDPRKLVRPDSSAQR